MRRVMVGAAMAAATLPAAAGAQTLQCSLPTTIPRPHVENAGDREPRRLLPIGGYTLALTWSPEYCHGHVPGRARGSGGDDLECGAGNRFGFTLHGLWPDGVGRDWPQYCRAAPVLAPATIRAHLCQTPSAQLMQHEWAKHGSCMGGSAEQYFARSAGLYAKLRFPDMDGLSRDRTMTAGKLADALAGTNPGLPVQAIHIAANQRGWLNEVWLCLDRRFAYTRCRAEGAGAGERLKIWRGSVSRGSSRRRGGGGRDDDE